MYIGANLIDQRRVRTPSEVREPAIA